MLRKILVAFALLLLPQVALAHGTVLTVYGKIANSNRGPVDPFVDVFLEIQGIAFDKAMTFTWTELEALGMEEMTVQYPNWPGAVTVKGPRLSAVLAAAGAEGDKVRVAAVDGYSYEFEREVIDSGAFILALEADGKPLAMGGRGPSWLVFPPGSVPFLDSKDDTGLVWAVMLIEVK